MPCVVHTLITVFEFISITKTLYLLTHVILSMVYLLSNMFYVHNITKNL